MKNSINDLELKLKMNGIEAAIKRLEKEDLQPHDMAYINGYRNSNKDEHAINEIKLVIKELASIFGISAEISHMMNYK